MICKLCNVKKADKKNTHYLTDSIIRTCLNLDGVNVRDAGFYFDVSNNTPFVNFNFQRGTSIIKLEESLGRTATEEEIEKAKEIPFSVDYVFCSDCEDIFTRIETPFIETILPDLRQNDLTGIERKKIGHNKIGKLFFYLQVWRTAICQDIFNLEEETMESLRLTILNSDSIDNNDIPKFPFHITYLQTTLDDNDYTTNLVGCTSDRNPNIIFINDFVIQFFENEDSIKELDFYGLNQSNDLTRDINIENEYVNIKILSNQRRLEILGNILKEEKVQKTTSYFRESFSKLWIQIFGGSPQPYLIQEYLEFINSEHFDVLKYTEVEIIEKTTEFIYSKIS